MTTNNRSIPIVAAILASAALCMPNRAEATLAQTVTFDQKVENAAAIVAGQVVKKESKFDPSRRWILTYTTFRVDKTLKGGAGGEITVVTPGGRVGEIYQDTIGVPEFKEGREHVLFVKNSEAGPTVLYFDQGAYDLIRDEQGQRIVAPVASDAVRVDTQRGVAIPEEVPRTLQQFETEIRTSERRAVFHRMEMVRKQQEQKQTSIFSTMARYKFLFAAALIGLTLATIHLLRR
ncbi:MAG TPA: hypothetical protein VMS98_18100 [Thermoanaerobaculia bacterium]|nr:hypothetical protein [Thermoanaerobaculia bacterium]